MPIVATVLWLITFIGAMWVIMFLAEKAGQAWARYETWLIVRKQNREGD